MLNQGTPGLARIAVGAGALIVVAAATPALAQSSGSGGAYDASGTVGANGIPTARGLSDGVAGQASLSVRYDPQAARGDDDVARARGLAQKELTYTLTGDLNAGRQAGNLSVGLGGTVDYFIHEKNSQLNTRSYSLTPLLGLQAGPCGTLMDGGIQRRQSLLEQTNLTYLRNTDQNIRVNANLGCALSSGLQGGVQANYVEETNSAGRSRDSEGRGVSAYVGYGNASLGSISFVVSYSKTEYDDPGRSLTVVAPPEQEAVTYMVRYTRPLIRNLTGSVGVGYTFTDFDGAQVGKTEDVALFANLRYELENLQLDLDYQRGTSSLGLSNLGAGRPPQLGSTVTVRPNGTVDGGAASSYRAQGQYRLGQSITFRGLLRSDLSASELAGASFQRSQAAELGVAYDLTEDLTFQVRGDYGRDRYRGQLILPGGALTDVIDLTKTSRRGFSADANYRLGERITATLQYALTKTKTSSLVPLDLSPISQLRNDRSERIGGTIGVELPFDSRLALDLSYERRRASVDDFSFNALRAGAVLSIRF